METDCIIALIAGIMVLVSGSVIGFYSWDKVKWSTVYSSV